MTDVDRYKEEFDAGEFVRVEGRGSNYNGRVELVLSTIRRVNPDQDRREGFREEETILSAPRPIDEMWAELQGHLQAVKSNHLRVLLNRIVSNHEAQLRVWPAAQVIHHAYRGGFLEHITKMAEVGRLVSTAYGADWDLVFAGIVGWILLGEALGPLQILGGALILGGIVLVRLERRPADAASVALDIDLVPVAIGPSPADRAPAVPAPSRTP